MNDEPLLAALRELSDLLSAVDAPHAVIYTFPRLRQSKSNCLLPYL